MRIGTEIKKVALNNNIRQLCAMQEEYMANKSLDLDSRINVVKYLEEVKSNINKVLNNSIEIENISNN